MNLWTLVSTIIISFGLTASPAYRLPTVTVNSENTEATLNLETRQVKESKLPFKVDNNSLGVKLTATSAAVLDRDSGIVLWQKNAEEVRSIASISKLMTAIVFLENRPSWNDLVTMEEKDETHGNTPNILRGETVRVSDLFYVALVASDNNAAKALVRSTGMSESEFVAKMNKKAQELGLSNTVFSDPTGLTPENKSTALEILKLAQAAFSYEDIADVTSTSRYTLRTQGGRSDIIYSTNWLLNSYLDVEAGKTGYIGASGYCLVTQVVGDEGQRIITVVLNSETNDHRFYDSKVLSSWILDNFIWS